MIANPPVASLTSTPSARLSCPPRILTVRYRNRIRTLISRSHRGADNTMIPAVLTSRIFRTRLDGFLHDCVHEVQHRPILLPRRSQRTLEVRIKQMAEGLSRHLQVRMSQRFHLLSRQLSADLHLQRKPRSQLRRHILPLRALNAAIRSAWRGFPVAIFLD